MPKLFGDAEIDRASREPGLTFLVDRETRALHAV